MFPKKSSTSPYKMSIPMLQSGSQPRKRMQTFINLSTIVTTLFATILVPNIAQSMQQLPTPTFTKNMDNLSVKENLQIGEVVYQLEAVLEGGRAQEARILYGIEDTQLFSVDRLTGQVKVVRQIDREQTGDSVTFQVSATTAYKSPNGLQLGHKTQIKITVYILDENDNPPKIEHVQVGSTNYDSLILSKQTEGRSSGRSPIIRLNVNEATPAESVVVDLIEAIDVDKASTNPLRAMCLGCEPEFELRSATTNLLNDRLNSTIVLVSQLSHEPNNNLRHLHIIINDGKYNSSIMFEITIDDVQNKPPQFIGSTTCIVRENTAIDKTIMTVYAVDGDAIGADEPVLLGSPNGGQTGRKIIYDFITHSRQSASAYENFKLHPLTGQLQVANRLDREAHLQTDGVVSLSIRARELKSMPPMSTEDDLFDVILEKYAPYVDNSPEAVGSVEITVILADVNDNEPHWLNSSEIKALNLNESPDWYSSLPNDRDTGRTYRILVRENSLSGSPIMANNEMFVYDLDNGDNAEFSISLEDPFNLFDVEPKKVSGFALVTLKLASNSTRGTRLLDYENVNDRSFIIQLIATETKTGEKLSSKAQVQINVVDVNDNAPEFKELPYVNIREDAQAGKLVTVVQATDKDESSKHIIYSLHGKSAYLFDLNRVSGHLTVAKCFNSKDQMLLNQGNHIAQNKNCIDYEQQKAHHLMVEASDGELSTKRPLTVFIDDANDNPPKFLLPVVDVVIEEGSDRFDPPIKLEATDLDNTSVLSYSILEGNFEELFSINNITGELQLTRPIRITHNEPTTGSFALDYRQQQLNKMFLVVQASDGLFSTNATVRIDILDSNDNAPKFLKKEYTIEINEQMPLSQTVATVQAIDLDRGNNARVSYRIERGSHSQFEIDEMSGRISIAPTAREFDVFKRRNYTLVVVAYDHGLIPKSSSVLVHIHVLGSIRRAPEFEPKTQRIIISENLLNNSIIHKMSISQASLERTGENPVQLAFEPGPIEALDKNGHQVTETEKLEQMFSVSYTTGEIMVNSVLDHDFATLINLTIFVSARHSSSKSTDLIQVEDFTPRSSGYLLINIVDDNTNPPMFAAPWSAQQPELTFQMQEELPVGSILTQLVASDVDSKISHFRIDPPNDYFELTSPQSGIIVNKKVIDYDSLMSQTFLSPSSSHQHHHRLGLGHSTAHQANPQNFSNNIIQFSVYAYDSGVPQLFAKAIVGVEILPLNDWDCSFEKPIYEVRVKENTLPDTLVAQVRAIDLDYGEQHNSIRYQLFGDQRDLFNIDPKTGVVTVSNKGSNNLDRERLPQLNFTLIVIGRDEPSSQSPSGQLTVKSRLQPQTSGRTCTATIRVQVEDVNDNPPLFSQKTYEVTAYDTDALDVPLVKLMVRDDDYINTTKLSGPVNSFRILSGNINDSFNISTTGLIYATKPLNESMSVMNGPIQLRVQVKQQSPSLTSGVMTTFTDECLVRVSLVKINRYGPEWRVEFLKSPNIKENMRPGTLVAQLKCTDRDYEMRSTSRVPIDTEGAKSATAISSSPIRYWIKENGSSVSETNEFKLDPITGNLITRVELDREAQDYYILIVACEDNGKPQSLESITPLYISVLDVDDNKPEFLVPRNQDYSVANNMKQKKTNVAQPLTINLSVEEHQVKGLPVGELKAIDRDLESSFPITYCIVEGNEFQEFSLDRITGILYTNNTLDREKQSTYDLLVRAINDASTCENHVAAINKSPLDSKNATKVKLVRNERDTIKLNKTRQIDGSDKSLLLVKVSVLDINDNAPIFKRTTYRAGAHHRSLMNTLLTQVAAYDPDAGINGSLSYKISEILMYKTSSITQQPQSRKHDVSSEKPPLSKPIQLIHNYPFRIDQQGNIYTQQLLTQYQLMSMFVLQIEATELAEPWRKATTKLEIYVYETSSQLKIRINMHPRLVEAYKPEIETLLSNATKYTAIINRARSYHGNVDSSLQTKPNANIDNQKVPILDLGSQNSFNVPTKNHRYLSSSNDEPSFSNIHLIFVDNYRIVNPNLVMDKFDLTSAQLFSPQLIMQQSGANNNNLDGNNQESQWIGNSEQASEVSSLIDKIALASVQSAEYQANPSTLAGIDWLESPSVILVGATILLTVIGLLTCLIGCCCTSRIKDHIIKAAMDKLVKQQTLQAKINERVMAATNAAHVNASQDYLLQQGGFMSAFDATKGCTTNNHENMNILQRAADSGEFIPDPNYTTLNGHINLGAHYFDASKLDEGEEQPIMNGNGNNHHIVGTSKQLNGSTISLSDEFDANGNGGDLNNDGRYMKKSKLYTNGGAIGNNNQRQRQQIPSNN